MTPDEPRTGIPTNGEPGTPPDSESAASLARRRRRLAVAGVALVLVGAVGSFALSSFPASPPGEGEPAPSDDGDAPGSLAAREAPRRPVPAGAADVEVVERGTDTPVPGVTVLLRHELAGDRDVPFEGTDANGRARLFGTFPAFVEVDSDLWTADPRCVPVDEKTSVRIEVVPRTPFLVRLVDEVTGLPMPAWTIGCVDGDAAPATKADEQGVAALPRRHRPPELVAATDGRRRVHLFLLAAVPGRDDARLEIAAAERTTTVRAVDEAGGPIGGAIVAIGSESTGVTIACDERGEATLEYGARTTVPVVVSSPGRSPRALTLEGAPSASVVLLATAERRFRLRTADGTRVPEGARVTVFARGPAAYGLGGIARASGPSPVESDDAAKIAGLPGGAFEALVLVEGGGFLTLARVRAGDDPSAPIDVVVGPGRRFVIGKIPGEAEGPPTTAIVRVDGRGACGADVREEFADVFETFARGRAVDAFGACFVVRGPEAEILLPRSTEPRRVEVLTPTGEFACFVVLPDEPGGSKTLAFSMGRAPTEPSPTTLRVEWAGGGAAEMVSLEVRKDERGADAVAAYTDSSGAAVVRLGPGRYVVEAVTSEGARFVGDGPVLVPSTGPVLLRLHPVSR